MKIKSVSSLKPEERLEFFVRKVVDFEQVWGLYGGGWAASNIGGREMVPFWPELEFASLCATGTWSDFSPRKISIQVFLSNWLPGMRSDSRLCQIFPAPESMGLAVCPAELEAALRDELEQYE